MNQHGHGNGQSVAARPIFSSGLYRASCQGTLPHNAVNAGVQYADGHFSFSGKSPVVLEGQIFLNHKGRHEAA